MQDLSEITKENLFLRSENETLRSQVKFRDEMIQALKNAQFGSKKEKWIGNDTLPLFNEAEVEASKSDEAEESEFETVATESIQPNQLGNQITVKARGKRKPLPENLPREIVVIELPKEEQVSDAGIPLIVIGKDISEKLVYEPSRTKVIEYHRLKYGIASGDYCKTAKPVPSIIPKGIVTPSLLGAIVVSKYCDSLPLYRQEEILARQGIDISRGSMGRWIIQSAVELRPLWNLLQDRLLSSNYVQCDETPVQVLKEKGRRAESKSWMWVRQCLTESGRLILFDYDPSRSGIVARNLFQGFRGYLQVDGYGGYNCLEKNPELTRIGCNMHGRRYFHEAWKTGAKTGKEFANQALAFYHKLYALEESTKALSHQERYEFRNEHAAPVWKSFNEWANENGSKVPKESKIGKAFGYFRSENELLMGYLKDGQLEMDNGEIERMIKSFAIGRKNWLFSDTEDGAEASALYYSLCITAKANGVNPYLAFVKLFERIPLCKSADDYESLIDLFMKTQVTH